MTADDVPAFGELMLELAEGYGESMSELRIEVYFRALADLELADIRRAATAHVKGSKFFPKPSEIREAIHGSVEDQAEFAWGVLLRTVRAYGYWNEPTNWPDPAAKRAAYELYGGWKALCERLPADGPGMAVAAKQFKSTYSAYARRDQQALPAGSIAGVLTDGSAN